MSATARKQDISLITRPAAIAQEWQLDRVKRSAQHSSGLVVSWQTIGKGPSRQPALDIAGLEKVTASVWAGQVNVLVEQAIALLEGR